MRPDYVTEIERDEAGRAVRLHFRPLPAGEAQGDGGAADAPSGVTPQQGAQEGFFARCSCGQYFPDSPGKRYCSRRCKDAAYNAAHPVARRPAFQPALPGESRVERAFRAWIESEDGEVVEAEVVRRARRLQATGVRTWGIAGIWEAIRYDHAIGILGTSDGYRLNNSHRSLLARRVMERVPELRDFFTTRDLRGRA